MGRKRSYTIEQQVEAVLDYKRGKRGARQICNVLGLHQSGINLYKWVHIYESYGEVGFLSKHRNKTYS